IDASAKSSSVTSLVISVPLISSLMRRSLISKPIICCFLPNSTATGKPTYPSPTTAIFLSVIMSPHNNQDTNQQSYLHHPEWKFVVGSQYLYINPQQLRMFQVHHLLEVANNFS